VHVVEGVVAALGVEPLGPVVGQDRRPASEIDPVEVQPPEQRGGVDELEREVGRFAVDLRVVERQRLGVSLLVHVEEGQVPVVVVGEAAAGRPVLRAR
jgi:hypothetical protein